jgi:crotonobetainyl-CoA:carnitine CoA-transferase CaiB-like acyl-CoA transferase
LAEAPLAGIAVVSTAVNLPGPAAAARLAELGAAVTKVEPPGGDPLEVDQELYRSLTAGQTIVRLNLKEPAERERLTELLDRADVLLTSSRPSALARLGLVWTDLRERHPRLVQVAIVGQAAPAQELAGHDLTYVARHGLVRPPATPQTLVADLGGAERAVTAALALLLARDRGGERYAEVALDDAAAFFALPLRHGLTTSNGPLGGESPFYRLYEADGGWIALAALEPRFRETLLGALDLEEATVEGLAATFGTRSPAEWVRWAEERDLPLAAVRLV